MSDTTNIIILILVILSSGLSICILSIFLVKAIKYYKVNSKLVIQIFKELRTKKKETTRLMIEKYDMIVKVIQYYHDRFSVIEDGVQQTSDIIEKITRKLEDNTFAQNFKHAALLVVEELWQALNPWG